MKLDSSAVIHLRCAGKLIRRPPLYPLHFHPLHFHRLHFHPLHFHRLHFHPQNVHLVVLLFDCWAFSALGAAQS